MNPLKLLISAFFMSILLSCEPKIVSFDDPDLPQICRNQLEEKGKVYEANSKIYLKGGDSTNWDFDITNWSLKICNIKDYGLDREDFPALISPLYTPISEIPNAFPSTEKLLYLHSSEELKVYPYTTMTAHEAINEYVEGEPIMIAYCYLADLAAVYTRTYCEKELTFALTGYTYADPGEWEGLDGFLLWDRETESIWWPLIDLAVSGPMKDTRLKKYDQQKWGYGTWGDMLQDHPEALVLQSEPDWKLDKTIHRLGCEDLDCCP
ncbi:MAG: DUF3179 domain-containing (seleno)protein [Bacteroidota bacterium]